MVGYDDAGCLNAPIARAFFASGLAPTGATQILVGVSLLAMDVNDNAGCLNARIVRTFFAVRPFQLWERACSR